MIRIQHIALALLHVIQTRLITVFSNIADISLKRDTSFNKIWIVKAGRRLDKWFILVDIKRNIFVTFGLFDARKSNIRIIPIIKDKLIEFRYIIPSRERITI